jgi:Na+/melibiose symporter-like transporter
MRLHHETTRPRWFAVAAAAWMLFGTLFLVLMTMWNGQPFPAGVPEQPWGIAGFALIVGFVYVLPVWLALKERHYQKARLETGGFGALALAAGSLTLLWAAILFS